MSESRGKHTAGQVRGWYEGSELQPFFTKLGALDFGNTILIFGAVLLLSVLPIMILLAALASSRVDDDIAQHLGLDRQGSRIVEGLFRVSPSSFNLAIAIALLLGMAGTITAALWVQRIYERAFDHPHGRGTRNLLRCSTWVVVTAGLLISEGAISSPLRRDAGPLVLAAADFLGFALFFWWSMHFLLAGRETWRQLVPAAVATALFMIGLGVFSAFYFSDAIVSDNKLYGAIGVVFSITTWFIAIGAVLTLGAVAGVVWQERKKPAMPSAQQVSPGVTEPDPRHEPPASIAADPRE